MKPAPAPEQEIQPADPEARRKALWIALAAIALASLLALVIYFTEDRINLWLSENTEAMIRHPGVVFAVVFVAMLPLVGFSAWMFRQANQIIRSERIPPPGQKVIKDTPVITGRKAVRQGRLLKILTVFMTVFFLLVPFWIVLILMTLNKSI